MKHIKDIIKDILEDITVTDAPSSISSVATPLNTTGMGNPGIATAPGGIGSGDMFNTPPKTVKHTLKQLKGYEEVPMKWYADWFPSGNPVVITKGSDIYKAVTSRIKNLEPSSKYGTILVYIIDNVHVIWDKKEEQIVVPEGYTIQVGNPETF